VREYDTTFIVQPEISEEGREALLEKLAGVLTRAGAVPLEVDDQGKRKLAYEIDEFQKGHYLSLFYLDVGPAVTELERTLRLEESVLRFLTVQKEDGVTDVDGRKTRAIEAERTRRERAAERAAREAEERSARELAREEAEAEARTHAEAEDGDEGGSDEFESEGDGEDREEA
jgi:small subunit ribosomal protein S6